MNIFSVEVEMTEAVILDAIRTPIGAQGGGLSSVRPDDLAAHCIKAIVARNQLDPTVIDEVILGCANQAGEDNRNIARFSSLLAGLPVTVPAFTVNRLCASGLTAINLAARAIKAGEGDVFIVGGVESMSRAPYVFAKSEQAFPPGNLTVYDTSIGWRFPNPRFTEMYTAQTNGETAENIAEQFHKTRQEQDEFALASHQRAIAAIDSGKFIEEIFPVPVPQKKGDPVLFAQDERPRRDTSLESLGKLRPIFRKEGGVTAGNSSGVNDGSAALLIMSDKKAAALGYKPLARWVTSASVGLEPTTMGLGPIPATRKALQKAGMNIGQIGLAEINEAFAVQALICMQELGLNHQITNINGGAVALGHPLGCSGARIMVTLLHEMGRRSAQTKSPYYGLATLCVGIGQGEAAIIEYVA
jgi:3-oxoadipyl-CoA thiolase